MHSDGPIVVALHAGDALEVEADVAIIGSNPTLRQRIETSTGKTFERLGYPDHLVRKYGRLDGIRTTEVLRSSDFRWKETISIRSRPSRKVRRRFQIELVEMMLVEVRNKSKPASVVMVPYNTQPELVVATNMLFFVWCMMREAFGKRSFHHPALVTIASNSGLSVFRHLICTHEGALSVKTFIASQKSRDWLLSHATLPVDPLFALRD